MHCLLFLAQSASYAESEEEISFGNFVRTKNGVYSPVASHILSDLRRWGLVEQHRCTLTARGREVYYALASLLVHDQNHQIGFSSVQAYVEQPALAISAVHRHLIWRRARVGDVLQIRGKTKN